MTDEEKRLQEQQNPYAVDGDAVYSQYRTTSGAGERPVFEDTYGGQLKDLYSQIAGRGDFQYDLAKDPLYQQYADRYRAQGQAAMRDTMGQAAALSGGYGNSYGMQAGQQAYDNYLTQLNDVVPELYDRAYGAWQGQGQRLQQLYGMVGAQQDAEYARYRDAVGDWETDRNRQDQQAANNYSQLYALIGSSGYQPTDEELASAGMTRDAAEAIRQMWIASNPQLAWYNGALSPEDFYRLTGMYPAGYEAPGAAWEDDLSWMWPSKGGGNGGNGGKGGTGGNGSEAGSREEFAAWLGGANKGKYIGLNTQPKPWQLDQVQ